MLKSISPSGVSIRQADKPGPKPQPPTDPTDSYSPGQHESFCDVAKALPTAFKAPLEETYATTKQFIKDHPFFHQGLMDLPIGGGKHFRNVPFIGPGRVVLGAVTFNGLEIKKGVETTRGTWAAE